MLRSINEIVGYKLHARDGELGKVKEFYFDDELWTIRYMIADTGNWLLSRDVLISPDALKKPDWKNKELPVDLSKTQIENSPEVDLEKPVSRQQEYELRTYYGWPYYWTGVGSLPGTIPYPAAIPPEKVPDETSQVKVDQHLRSTNEVTNYNIQAKDGEIGHVEDFIIDDDTWSIRYIVVDTKNWLPGKKVLVAITWINRIDWVESKVYIDLDTQSIKNSPEYDPEEMVNREYEGQLYDFYGRPKYWEQ